MVVLPEVDTNYSVLVVGLVSLLAALLLPPLLPSLEVLAVFELGVLLSPDAGALLLPVLPVLGGVPVAGALPPRKSVTYQPEPFS